MRLEIPNRSKIRWPNSGLSEGKQMRQSLLAAACAACASILVSPALAVTFPSLTTIYVGTGVRDFGSTNLGLATVINCSNVSGQTASVRYLVLSNIGAIEASVTTSVPHGQTATAVTHQVVTFLATLNLNTGDVGQGVLNIESTQSGVFCNAMVVEGDTEGNGITLPLVRINSHPGAQE
jgi:hypothetical protein